jgi:predicted  nucleic acid-binding Zn-ribbon protein
MQQEKGRLSLAEDAKSRAASELSSQTAALNRLKDTQSKQREALVIMNQMSGLTRLTDEQQQQLSMIELELKDCVAVKQQRVEELTRSTTAHQRNVVESKQLREQISALDDAQSKATTYHQLASELPSLEQTARDAETEFTHQQGIVTELRARTTSIQGEIAVLTLERARQMGSVEKIRSLLADIQQYVAGSECPLCGHEWHSQEELRRAVDERTTWLSPRVKQLDEQLMQMQQRLSGSQTILAQAEALVVQISARRDAAVSRSSDIHRAGIQLREMLMRGGVPPNVDVSTIASLKGSKTVEYTRANETVVNAEGALARLRDELSQLESESVRKEEVRQRMAARLADTLRRLNELKRQLESLGLRVEPDAKLVEQQIDGTSHEIEVAEQSRSDALGRLTNAEASVEEYKITVAVAERSAIENERSTSALRDALKRVGQTLRDADLEDDADPDMIRAKRLALDARTAALDDARLTVKRLNEISSWLIARREMSDLKVRADSITGDNEALKSEELALRRWHSHLSTLYVALVSIKAEVEMLQLEKYGPTINVLYQRLNTHPLFTQLRVLVDASSQSVRIHLPPPPLLTGTDGQDGLAPVRYLSEAQINVAALSIFLSHSFQQRWSSFVPLFLDDPVQTMDDFNANGFVDCLRSLAGLDRQFIISTCDLDLYRLLLLKLRCMNYDGHVKFRAYRLQGISEQGPSVIQDYPISGPMEAGGTEITRERVH